MVSKPVYELFKMHKSEIVSQVACALVERLSSLRHIDAERKRYLDKIAAAESAYNGK